MLETGGRGTDSLKSESSSSSSSGVSDFEGTIEEVEGPGGISEATDEEDEEDVEDVEDEETGEMSGVEDDFFFLGKGKGETIADKFSADRELVIGTAFEEDVGDKGRVLSLEAFSLGEKGSSILGHEASDL